VLKPFGEGRMLPPGRTARHQWHGLAFVDGTGGAGSLAGALAELDELAAPYEPERLVIRGRHTYNAASN